MAETQKSGAVGRGGGDEEGASRPGGSARERDVRRLLRVRRKAYADGGESKAGRAALLVAAHRHAGSGARNDLRLLQRCIRETNEPRATAAAACAGGRVPRGVNSSVTARIMSGGAGAHDAARARANPGASDGAEDGAAAGDGRRRSARVRAAVNACAGNQATTDAQILAAGAGGGDDAGEATGAGADGSGGGEGAGVGDAAGIACAGNQATTDAQILAAGACGGDDAGEAAGAGAGGSGEGEGASAGDAAGGAGVLVASVAVSRGARAARHAQSDSDAVVAAVMAEIGDEREMMATENQPDAPEWAMLCECLPALPEPADGMVRHGAAAAALALDEQGLPDTIERATTFLGRLEAACSLITQVAAGAFVRLQNTRGIFRIAPELAAGGASSALAICRPRRQTHARRQQPRRAHNHHVNWAAVRPPTAEPGVGEQRGQQ